MSHAGTKLETKITRTAHPGRSHGGPSLRPPAATGRSAPPPPPSAALQLRASQVEELPIVPQWVPDASNSPLSAPPPSSAAFWMRVVGFGFGAGLLLSAGYLFAVAQQQPTAPQLVRAAAAPADLQPTAAAMPARQTEILTSTAAASAMPSELDLPLGKQAPEAKPAKATTQRSVAKRVRPARKAKAAKPMPAVITHDAEPEEDVTAPPVPAETAKLARKPVKVDEKLPEQPSREDVKKGLDSIRPKLVACAQGQHGTSYANLTIVGEGRVSYSVMEGDFQGTPAGSCMARALRTATFPRFSGPAFKVNYPFAF